MVHSRDSYIRGECSDIHNRFESFVVSCEKAYGLSLARPRFDSDVDIKKFCSGLLEGQIDHPWKIDFQRANLSSVSRMSLSFSLFLFRKLVPSEKPQLGAYFDKMTTPQGAADPEFLHFCRTWIRGNVPTGWDRSYRDKCTRSVLPISSCYENGRRDGGARGLIEQAKIDREEFSSYVLESVAPRPRGVSRVQAVLAGDKWRIITIPPLWDNSLRPFHQSLYDFVSRQEWCLRGDAKPGKFSKFVRVDGEIFESGDYESATDNLNTEVQTTILTELILKARQIPRGISLHALSTFNSMLECEGDVREQARGQLMGQLLSFPLLCLVNYLAFKFAIPRDVPVKINGDDIVFRSTKDEADHWREKVKDAGLTLSAGKTLRSGRFFSLNSCLFDAGRAKVRFVPFVRPRALWGSGERECERVMSLAPRWRSFLMGMGKQRSSEFQLLFLSQNRHTILRCRRSLTRGMGMKVSEDTLRRSGLWSRELFYLERESEPKLPAYSFSQLKCNDIPHGWVQASPHWHPPEVVKGWNYRLGIEMSRSAWTRSVIKDKEAEEKWMSALDAGASPWGMQHVSHKRALVGLSRRQFWRWMCIRGNRDFFGRVTFSRGKGVWMPGTYSKCDNDKNIEESSARSTEFLLGGCGEYDLCPICQETNVDAVVEGCKHGFCRHCISLWKESNDSCPLCRKQGLRTLGALQYGPVELDGVKVIECSWVDYDEDS